MINTVAPPTLTLVLEEPSAPAVPIGIAVGMFFTRFLLCTRIISSARSTLSSSVPIKNVELPLSKKPPVDETFVIWKPSEVRPVLTKWASSLLTIAIINFIKYRMLAFAKGFVGINTVNYNISYNFSINIKTFYYFIDNWAWNSVNIYFLMLFNIINVGQMVYAVKRTDAGINCAVKVKRLHFLL